MAQSTYIIFGRKRGAPLSHEDDVLGVIVKDTQGVLADIVASALELYFPDSEFRALADIMPSVPDSSMHPIRVRTIGGKRVNRYARRR